jgi:hypothetical protein
LCLGLLDDASFVELLLRLDREMAAEVQAGRCPQCEGPLHVGHFCRKPRGWRGREPTGFDIRFDFCCGWCRKRCMPPSIRFLGRRVYLGVVVTLATVLRHGATPWRLAKLQAHLGMSAVTVERWRRWWQQQLPVTSLWARVRGQLPSVLCLAALPSSLLECFVGSAAERMVALLRLLSPLSTQSCPERAWR